MDQDYSFMVRNLDTGEAVGLDEASEKFNVLTLRHDGDKKGGDEDKIYKQLSDDDEDYYFDAMLESLDMADAPEVNIPTGARLQFIKISAYETVHDKDNRSFCVFFVEVRCNVATPSTWTVYRRYSQFRKLNDALRSEGYYVPVMPSKNLLSSFKPDFLKHRRAELEAWLQHLGAQHTIHVGAKDPQSNPAYRAFLTEDANHPPFRIENNALHRSALAEQKTPTKDSGRQGKDVSPLRSPGGPGTKVSMEDFELVRVIGKGSFGKVTLVKKKSDQKLYAMKVLSKPNIVKRKQVEHTRTERRVLGTINHPFIVKLHYAFQTESKLYFVLDYAAGGELFFHLSRMKKFNENMTCFFCAEITLALEALHGIGVIYRDLKPENILLDAQGHIKLADFGLAKENVHEAVNGASSLCGTPEYLSPEVLDRQGHGHAVDWWNLGMVTFEMLTGLPPWYTTDKQKLFDRLRNAPLKFPYSVSRQAASFIQGLLTRQPADRLGSGGAGEVKSHRFFSGIDWTALYHKEVTPPFDPCRNQLAEDSTNFEKEFTQMPLGSLDESNIQLREREVSDTFMNFTYEEESYLERVRSSNASPESKRGK